MVGLSLLAGPYFARALKLDKKGLIIAAVLLILCIPNLLILASYAYYKPAVDSQQVEAGLWIRENTPENSVFLQKMELGGLGYDELCPGGNPIELSHWDTRQLFAYHSAFGERRGYLGDLRGLYVYGENFCPALLTYFAVFDEKNEGAICGLKAAGVDYVYVSDPSWEPEGRATACLSLVFGNDGARIYEARGLSGQ
ncbi:MAG: hypothetical protein NT157_01490 [Candidatus Micrarchaeota archaeon]|nr:hypothetical protein [Candidatus Micrarchaeota archaeon]